MNTISRTAAADRGALNKRSPQKFDFGLGKKKRAIEEAVEAVERAKRALLQRYDFGLGKRAMAVMENEHDKLLKELHDILFEGHDDLALNSVGSVVRV